MKRALALSLILVVSVLAGGVAFGTQPAQATPSGYVSVADGQVYSDMNENTPMGEAAQEIANAGVMASSHADTLEVLVTNPGRAKKHTNGTVFGSGPIAIVVSDDQVSDGRTVALPATEITEILGHQPQMARGTHEDGEPWQVPIEYQDGWLMIDVPHFSSNTITFEGEVQIGDTFSDGSTVNYDISDLDAASDPVLNLTGKVNGEYDNVSGSSITLNHDSSVNIYENNVQATDGNGSDPQIRITAKGGGIYNPFYDESSGTAQNDLGVIGDDANNDPRKIEQRFQPSTTGNLKNISVNFSSYWETSYDVNVNIYVVQETPDGTYGEGTLVKENWSPQWDTTIEQTVSISDYSVTSGEDYTVEFVSQSSDNDGGKDHLKLNYDDTDLSGDWLSQNGDLRSRAFDMDFGISGNAQNVDVSDDAGASVNIGDISNGQTKTGHINLSSGTSKLYVNGTGEVDYELIVYEKIQTTDPGVQLNGAEWANHTGTLADGETAQYTLNSSTLQEGTNTIEVDTPDLSADAPPMQVQLDYSHDAADDQTVSYDSEKFSERYNVSHQYADANENPELTIPFAGDVVSLRDLEYRTNGGSWQELSESDYSLDNTTLTANLPDASAGDTHTVRANGSKVNVYNGEIKVLEPTDVGDRLDTKLAVESKSSGDLQLGFDNHNRVRYAYDENYLGEDYYKISQDNAGLIMPAAGQSDEMRISTIPVEADPQTNDVVIGVQDAKTSEPEFNVKPGNADDDEVAFTYLNAQSGTDYVLYSSSNNVVYDSETASSPITLWDDDSEETLAFMIDDSGASVSDPDSSGVLGPIGDSTDSVPTPGPSTLLFLGIPLVGIVGILYWRGGSEAVASAGSSTAKTGGSVLGWVVSAVVGTITWVGRRLQDIVTYLSRHPYAGGAVLGVIGIGVVGTGFITIPPEIATFLVVVGVPIVAYYLLVRQFGASLLVWAGVTVVSVVLGLQLLGTDIFALLFSGQAGVIAVMGTIGLIYYALRTYQAEATTPDEQTNVNFELEEGDN